MADPEDPIPLNEGAAQDTDSKPENSGLDASSGSEKPPVGDVAAPALSLAQDVEPAEDPPSQAFETARAQVREVASEANAAEDVIASEPSEADDPPLETASEVEAPPLNQPNVAEAAVEAVEEPAEESLEPEELAEAPERRAEQPAEVIAEAATDEPFDSADLPAPVQTEAVEEADPASEPASEIAPDQVKQIDDEAEVEADAPEEIGTPLAAFEVEPAAASDPAHEEEVDALAADGRIDETADITLSESPEETTPAIVAAEGDSAAEAPELAFRSIAEPPASEPALEEAAHETETELSHVREESPEPVSALHANLPDSSAPSDAAEPEVVQAAQQVFDPPEPVAAEIADDDASLFIDTPAEEEPLADSALFPATPAGDEAALFTPDVEAAPEVVAEIIPYVPPVDAPPTPVAIESAQEPLVAVRAPEDLAAPPLPAQPSPLAAAFSWLGGQTHGALAWLRARLPKGPEKTEAPTGPIPSRRRTFWPAPRKPDRRPPGFRRTCAESPS